MQEILKVISELDFVGKSGCLNKLAELNSRYLFLEKQYIQHLNDIERLTEIVKAGNAEKHKISRMSEQIKSLEEENIELISENLDLKQAFDVFIQLVEK